MTADRGAPGCGVTVTAAGGDGPGRLAAPVPAPGELVTAVLTEWELIDDGQQPYSFDLPRPWEAAACTDSALRAELWVWLEAFVSWVNEECLWDPGDLVPPCWPHHPHLVHELAVLAVQRRQASRTPTAWALEQWQTHSLPAFLTRAHTRLRRHCDTDHQPSPATAAHRRHQSAPEVQGRQTRFEEDVADEPRSR